MIDRSTRRASVAPGCPPHRRRPRRAEAKVARRWLAPLLVAVSLLVCGGALIGGGWYVATHLDDDDPDVSSRRVFDAIRKGDEGAIRSRFDTEQGGDASRNARRIVRFFRGWTIDPNSDEKGESGDDNAYSFGFTAHRPDGTRAEIRGSLWPQGETGEGPWKLSALWVEHGRGRDATMITAG